MRRAAAVLLLAFLAGCAQAPAPLDEGAATNPAPAVARVLDWSQADCESITWSVPVMATALQPYLPSGFEPRPPEASPASPGVDGAATLGFRAVECAYGFGEEKVLRSVQSGLLFTPVLPPSELREERFSSRYAFGWDVLVSSEDWRAAAGQWGLPLGDGGSMVGPTAQGWTGSLAIDGVGSFSVTGRTVDKAQEDRGFEARTITAGSQGFALWDSEAVNRSASAGVGTWTVSPESWVAAVLGTTSGIATYEHATFDLPAALVHWPGQALGPTEEGAPLRPADLVPPPQAPGPAA
jgi:hypothetical protein